MTAASKWRCTVAVFVMLVCASAAHAAPFTFSTLPPDPDEPGSTIGWGYTITNPNENVWLNIFSLDVLYDDGVDLSLFTPDTSIFDLPIVAPQTSVTLAYDMLAGLGLFQLTWDATLATVGSMVSGSFLLSADVFDGDPLGVGNALSTEALTATFTVVVNAPPAAAPVPEPATLLLVGTGLAAGALARRRRKRV